MPTKPHLRINVCGRWACDSKVGEYRFIGTGSSPNEAFTNCLGLVQQHLGIHST